MWGKIPSDDHFAYDAIIPSQLQILRASSALIGKAQAFYDDRGIPAPILIQAKLADDMLPFAYQVKSMAVHSIGAIEGVRRGVFGPDTTPPPADFRGLTVRLADAAAALEAIDPAEVESFIGRDMQFAFGERRLDFTAESFLLSFSQPNFYFHATTAYIFFARRACRSASVTSLVPFGSSSRDRDGKR